MNGTGTSPNWKGLVSKPPTEGAKVVVVEAKRIFSGNLMSGMREVSVCGIVFSLVAYPPTSYINS